MSDQTMPTNIDIEFKNFWDFIKDRDVNDIKEAVMQNLRHFKATNGQIYANSINFLNEHKLWGTYYPDVNDFQLAENRADALVNHMEDFQWIYDNLSDMRSKRILVNILTYWLMSDPIKIGQIYEQTFDQYFDLDIVKCDTNEVFVDIGGYIGDTLVNYTKVFGKHCYKRIYTYEIVAKNIELIEENIKLFDLDNVVIREKGASDRNGTMYLSSNIVSSISKLSDSGTYAIPIVKVDDDISEDITFIKMDIEGAEEEALLGCIEKIKKNHPKLALSVYHNHKDLWKLPRIIHEADPTYRFYLRYYGGSILPTEYLIYAI